MSDIYLLVPRADGRHWDEGKPMPDMATAMKGVNRHMLQQGIDPRLIRLVPYSEVVRLKGKPVTIRPDYYYTSNGELHESDAQAKRLGKEERWTVRNHDGTIRYRSPWLLGWTIPQAHPDEVDRVVDLNHAAPGTWDAIPDELDDGLVSYDYTDWVVTTDTPTRYDAWHEAYAIRGGIRAWIGRIEYTRKRRRG